VRGRGNQVYIYTRQPTAETQLSDVPKCGAHGVPEIFTKPPGSIKIIIQLETLRWCLWTISARPGRRSVGLGMAQSYPADVVILRCDAQLYTALFASQDKMREEYWKEKKNGYIEE